MPESVSKEQDLNGLADKLLAVGVNSGNRTAIESSLADVEAVLEAHRDGEVRLSLEDHRRLCNMRKFAHDELAKLKNVTEAKDKWVNIYNDYMNNNMD